MAGGFENLVKAGAITTVIIEGVRHPDVAVKVGAGAVIVGATTIGVLVVDKLINPKIDLKIDSGAQNSNKTP